MHDIKLIRENPEAFDAALARRGVEAVSDAVLEVDRKRRALLTELQEAQARHNALSKEFGDHKRGGTAVPVSLLAQLTAVSQVIEMAEDRLANVHKLDEQLAAFPNLPDPDVPDGTDEAQNVEVSRWGTPRQFNFEPQEHADLGPALGLDFETGVAISGARFTFLRGQMARLQRALGQFMLDCQTVQHGYTECAPPLLVKDEAVFGTGQLPKFEDDLFKIDPSFDRKGVREFFINAFSEISPSDDAQRHPEHFIERMERELGGAAYNRRWLIPTAEVSLTNSVREQILPETQLPIRLTALTPCFRSEAGAAGKDTRGYIRQHQFEKVELVTICKPEHSAAEHARMVKAAESILEALELPYRTMLLCAGDMGFTARKTFDLEVWLPGQGAYREISSISNCGDFQARRMNTRFRPEGAKGTEFVHTLNGSGLAVGRTLVAVLENYQQEDGSVTVPAALLPYMGGIKRLVPG